MKQDFSFQRSDRASRTVETAAARQAREIDGSASIPRPAEVIGEIGLLLAVHLAGVTAIVATLRAFGLD